MDKRKIATFRQYFALQVAHSNYVIIQRRMDIVKFKMESFTKDNNDADAQSLMGSLFGLCRGNQFL